MSPTLLHRRHTSACIEKRPRHERTHEFDEQRRGFRRCRCPIQCEGPVPSLGFVRRSTGATTWAAARAVVESWIGEGAVSRTGQMLQAPAAPLEHALALQPEPPPTLPPPADVKVTIAHGAQEFLADVAARQMDESTRRKYRTMLKQLQNYAATRGFKVLEQFDVDSVTRFRATWRDGIRSSAKKLERVKMFFRFAHEREWIQSNPAAKLKPPIGSSKPAHKHPFSDEEISRLFEACRNYQPRTWRNGFAEGEITGDAIQTFIMFLMYTGLRISDAATFSTDKLQGNNAFLFMHKTEEPVFTWLPDDLVARMLDLPLDRGKYFFMGPQTERKETAADMWRRKLADVFDAAGPWKIRPTPHRFRHTFARLLLERGVPFDDVATLMGHNDPKITLKHYGRWVPERQQRLTDILKSVWTPKKRAQLAFISGGVSKTAERA